MSAGRPRLRRCPRRAFTLVEAITTIVVLAIVSGVASNIVFTAADGYVDAATTAQLHTEATVGLDRAMRELRRIPRSAVTVNPTPDIDEVTPTSITWSGGSSIELVGSELLMTLSGESAGRLIGDVTVFQIRTYNENAQTLPFWLTGTACEAIRRVELEVTVERQGVVEYVRSRVFIRATMEGT